MTEKLPRRRSRRVVVSGTLLSPEITRVVSRASTRASPAPVATVPPPGSSSAEPSSTELSSAALSTAGGGTSVLVDHTGAEFDLADHELADPSGAPASGAMRRAALGTHRGPRALVVDDDPEIRRALARLLRPELDVYLVGSVAQAELCLARLDRVDVAFVDWELPDGTGEQILERLAHWPDAIRVLISARVATGEKLLENRALANLVLGKPLALGVVEALKRAALALPHG
jgi:CheY-like chemotaxis protein